LFLEVALNTYKLQTSVGISLSSLCAVKDTMIGWDQKVLTRKPLLGINKKPPRRAILQWILEAWDALPTDAIKRSFKSCALNLPVDGSDDDIIHCFKDKQPCSSGKAILDAQNHAVPGRQYWTHS